MERILGMNESCTSNDLIKAIRIVKDDFGKLDVEKYAHFISLLSFNKNTIASVADNMSKFYNTSPDANSDSISTYEVTDDSLGRISLPKDAYIEYMKLKGELDSLSQQIENMLSSRDKQIANLQSQEKYWYNRCSGVNNPYVIQQNDLLREYEGKLSEINTQISEIKNKMTQILLDNKE